MEQALQSNPIPDAGSAAMQPAWTSAIERHRSGDTEGAIVLYQRHLKRNPQDAPGWMNLGAALRRTGRRHGLLFLDGNADFYQPEASPTGEAADMDLALCTGRGPDRATSASAVSMAAMLPLVSQAPRP